MTVLLWVVTLPLLMWVYVGAAYTIWNTLIAVVVVLARNEMERIMDSYLHLDHPARLIRYTDVAGQDHPNLLSIYDETKNLIMIDRDLSQRLSQNARERLEMTTLPATMLAGNMIGFQPYMEFEIA